MSSGKMSKHISANIMEMCRPFVFGKTYNSKPYQFRLTHDISVDNFDFVNDDLYEFEKDFMIEHDNDDETEQPCPDCGNTSTGSGLYDNYDVCTCERSRKLSEQRDDSLQSLKSSAIKSSYCSSSLSGSNLFDELDESGYGSVYSSKCMSRSPSDPSSRLGRKRRRSGDPNLTPPRASSPMSMSTCSEKSLADEIFEAECIAALEKQAEEVGTTDGFKPPDELIRRLSQSLHVDFSLSFNPFLDVDIESPEDDTPQAHFPPTRIGGGFMAELSKASRTSSSSTLAQAIEDLEATHRAIHRFIPRHDDEMEIEIGDMIHVTEECDDLWCAGVNLRSGRRGIFPAVYAQDLDFMDSDENGGYVRKPDKFTLKFMGSVEVSKFKGTDVICQAVNKVVFSRRKMKTQEKPQLVTLQISDEGIKMMDKFQGKLANGSQIKHNHLFSFKNISFCGHHPKNEKYFGFVTKHPTHSRFAAHIFQGETSTKTVSDSVGKAFRRLHYEYMALTHPTEDIYIE